MEEEGSRRAAAAAAAAAAGVLPDELIVEILARLPVKSLCRCKCVSRTWRALISDPANSRKFAQTLSGLFYYRRRYHSHGSNLFACFVGLRVPPPPGVDTAVSFLPSSCAEMELLDSCNGLLLLRSPWWSPCPLFYIVCNPATGHWVTLPQQSHAPGKMCYDDEMMANKNTCTAALGFDPATSSHFYVFQLVEKEDQCVDIVVAVEIYFSETGKWIMRESGWSKDEYMLCNLQMTYLNGFLHLAIIDDAVASVDTKGQTWRVTHVRQRDEPDDRGHGFVGHSQGRLLYVDANPNDDSISIYVLEDHDRWRWTFKHSVRRLDLIPPRKSRCGPYFDIAALHPDGDLIYFYDWPRERIMSYDMTHGVVHVICTLSDISNRHRPFRPYVPLYSGPSVLSSAD